MVQVTEPQWRPKIGLALGSGVARGWAHLGVLRALNRYGIEPDVIVGTSIGAVVGGIHLAGKAEALEAWARSLTKVRMISYIDFRMRNGGMLGGRHLIDAMRHELGDMKIEDLTTPFVAVATDLVTGHEVWLRNGDMVDAMRTSFSLPGIFEPMQHDQRWLVDGALVNPVPVSVCRALGAQMVIAVNLNADIIGKERRAGSAVPTVAGFDLLSEIQGSEEAPIKSRIGALASRIFRREPSQPSMFGVMISALGIVQDRISRSRLAGEPPDVHITPRLGNVGLFEFDRADEIIAEGEDAVERVLPDLHDAISIFGREPQESGS
ncbi:lysophospholipase [Pelagibius litoralis]|uniref:Lysophospholipase n=1 Tax=Pelagibius litoralis TaxID=374515 RepID=A0A967CAL3_9PROT|nr:patatin-like phospholipase family protein [Pelagibius litoralis]NIA67499.1 lysophospholipase [Pelagibius litoralis]